MSDTSPAVRAAGRPRAFAMEAALDTAIIVFTERGYHGTSITELKAAMGLTAGSIYKAFKDKKAIFLAAFDRYKRVRAAVLEERLATAKTGREKVRAILHVYADAACGESGRRGCLAIGAAVELALFDEEVAERVARSHAALLAQIEGFIIEGQSDGSIAARIDPQATALSIFSFLQGIRIAGKSGQEAGRARASADSILAILD